MGVYIDMEMPTTYPLTVTIYPDGQVLSETVGAKDIHGEAVSVPPHGRLIDEENICDKLRPLIENPYCYNRLQLISETLAHCLQIISDAPTVIPASEEAE